MDSDLYDEFGNYIGPDLESDSEEEEYEEPDIDVSCFVDFLRGKTCF
jgi:116 kDa U5 small nuclear ribonucleoprotein component N-terminus